MDKVFCSCDGRPCEGVCSEEHLHKKDGSRCVAAYDVDENGKEIGQITLTEAFSIIAKKGK